VSLEHLLVNLDRPKEFDDAVHGHLAQASHIRLITKHNGTESGRAVACITFDVEIDGKIHTAQAVTTMRLLRTACEIILAKYNNEGYPNAFNS